MKIFGSIQGILNPAEMDRSWKLSDHSSKLLKQLEKKYKLDQPEEKDSEAAKKISQIEQFMEEMKQFDKTKAITQIQTKLKSGMSLTSEELDYLRINCPDLYNEAMKIEQEREQYKKELENCRSKEDVEKLNMRKTQEFATQAKSIIGSSLPRAKKLELLDYLNMRTASIQKVHMEFTNSSKYYSLPDKREEDDDTIYLPPQPSERKLDLEV